MKKILSIFIILSVILSCSFMVSAEETLTSDSFTLHVEVIKPEDQMVPSDLRFNLFTESGIWLENKCTPISEAGEFSLEFHVPKYEIGKKFQLVPTTGAEYVTYEDKKYALYDEITIATGTRLDENGETVPVTEAKVFVHPLTVSSTWDVFAEQHVNDLKVWSDTPYLIWVSKANYKVSVFLRDNGQWDCIKTIGCSIGAPTTPTITGQYRYHQYQDKWDYGSYYVGPIMRFYGGYAIHTTLVNNDGTDRDGRIGKMISHGCVRVRPDDMAWLVYYVPIGTKIYLTNE